MFIILSSDKYLKNEDLELCNTIDEALKIPDDKDLDVSVLLGKVREKYDGEHTFACHSVSDAIFNKVVKNIYNGSQSEEDIIKYNERW